MLFVTALIGMGVGQLWASEDLCTPEIDPDGSRNLRVGLFADAKSTDEKSREGAFKLLNSTPGIKAEKITSATIMSPELYSYDVLLFPGGTANGDARAIGTAGGKRIEEFVASGKGFIGICAGGYLMVQGWNELTSSVQLINAYCFDDDHWARGEGEVKLRFPSPYETLCTSETIRFENGPIFAPAKLKLPDYVSLAKFDTDMAAKDAPKGMMIGRDAIIAARFGKGRAVGFSPHPEQSPTFHALLISAVRWAAKPDDGSKPTVKSVLLNSTN